MDSVAVGRRKDLSRLTMSLILTQKLSQECPARSTESMPLSAARTHLAILNLFLYSRVWRARRGAHISRVISARERELALSSRQSAVEDAGDACLEAKDAKADRTFLIKEGWKEVYLMCAYGIPPDSWKEDLTEEL